jgi:Opioid growth factor receptor (OGFr) conserved region
MAVEVVQFLNGTGIDHRGRSLEDILAWPDDQLEIRHDYIQWLFPLSLPSAAVHGSPVLSEADIEAIRSDAATQKNMLRALDRMRLFYTRTTHWLTPGNHNHLRITRIISSLYKLGQPTAARDFYDFVKAKVEAAPGSVTPLTLSFWEKAVQGRH